MCHKNNFGKYEIGYTFVCMKTKKKKAPKKKEAKSMHWPLRIKTHIAKKIIGDVDEGRYENKAEAVNSILADHYEVKISE